MSSLYNKNMDRFESSIVLGKKKEFRRKTDKLHLFSVQLGFDR